MTGPFRAFIILMCPLNMQELQRGEYQLPLHQIKHSRYSESCIICQALCWPQKVQIGDDWESKGCHFKLLTQKPNVLGAMVNI